MPSSHLKLKHNKPAKMQTAGKKHPQNTPPNTTTTPTTTTTTIASSSSSSTPTQTPTTSPKPFAIRVCSAGGSVLPLHEALGNIKTLVAGTINLSPGYESYTRRLLLPLPTEYDTAHHDDLSADEAYELPTPRDAKPSNWRKVRNIVQWTPFIQTYKKHKYPWVQLAGHQGNFRAGHKQGTILKKLCPAEEKALEAIMKDILRPYVPRYSGVVEGADGEKYLQLEDLLSNYSLPCVMDIKMGVRTYLEDELAKAREKPKLRKDMYEKMIQIDSKAPTEAEHRAKAVTKPRYMVWRETISSTATQGFRIEGVRRGDGTSSKDFKTTRTREQVLACLSSFLQGYPHVASRYVQQLKSIKMTLEASPFFKAHELIGSSLLFVHNDSSALVRMIDFAKTVPLPRDVNITHRSPWSEGTHEDGYLLGLDNLIDLFSSLQKTLPPPVPLPLTTPNGTVSSNKSPLTPTSPSISSDSTSSSPTSSSSSSSKFSSSSSSFSSSSSSTISTSASFPSAPSTSSTNPAGPGDTGGGGGGDGGGGVTPEGGQEHHYHHSPLSATTTTTTTTTTTSSTSHTHQHPTPTPST
ncbi:inositol-trisphosphate 3-kinase A-like isoform X2 [Eriocheir sinensis]|uniref:inositol-trisphosphate 3-kinase A-like isoform X2 n=1 Tax=Eriocheir sinensis TaxID=95602 RepID=UPI0021C7B8DD|nr:inositol-trisphosphate 3-kinase A-like isoform X2 [Eriocheir sinensis]XP_050711217.1 inositol-trisphosphate 3-kinase A-like isoform X2 [Eriocheir sinensis]XP_050711218.1 inositol-trisphosphate 3-kinase A-like isoform X2 [Eriocheir sinensis]XP_050711219.1 inositol-trisphosphate 3-kinase A-like isoform X2 [Eriocheir sinensis]